MSSSMIVKRENMEIVRSIISKTDKISKGEIAKETKLSFPTVTRLLQELCETGEVVELVEKDSTGGRNASLYSRNDNYSLYLLVAIDKSTINWSIRNECNELINSDSFNYNAKTILDNLDTLINEKETAYSNLRSVSFGFAAMVDSGVVKENIWEGLEGVDLFRHFSSLTNLPISIDNDMNIVALGQFNKSSFESKSSVCIYRGRTGWFGAGLIINNQVWHGKNGLAGEIDLLPFMKDIVTKDIHNIDDNEITDIYSKFIMTYASLLNIEEVILYQNEGLNKVLDRIRKRCFDSLPEELMPNIELSNQFEEHYEIGLFMNAKNIYKESEKRQ